MLLFVDKKPDKFNTAGNMDNWNDWHDHDLDPLTTTVYLDSTSSDFSDAVTLPKPPREPHHLTNPLHSCPMQKDPAEVHMTTLAVQCH